MASNSRPSRPAREQLRRWLDRGDRTQGLLAQALGVRQQTVSRLIGTENVPSEELADLIEAATGVRARGWFTDEERAAKRKRIARARMLRSASP